MDPLILLVVAGMMGLAASLTLAVYRTVSRPPAVEDFETVLERVTGGELSEFDATLAKTRKLRDGSVFGSWNRFWLQAAERAGRVVEDPSAPGRVALIAAAVTSLFGVLVYPGGAAGVYLGVVALVAGRLWLSFEQGKRKLVLEKQMPLLLSGLRTQMHAGVTVQGALVTIADDLPSPLGEELVTVKQDIAVGVPLDKALGDLANRMDSRLMQFLVASIGVALRSGSDLVPQLITIEEIVRQRARIQGKIRSALALAKPTSYLAMAAPLVMFGWLSITDPNYLTYWFTGGLLFFVGAIVWYALGVVVIRLMIRNVERT